MLQLSQNACSKHFSRVVAGREIATWREIKGYLLAGEYMRYKALIDQKVIVSDQRCPQVEGLREGRGSTTSAFR
jgi:hypothetical protein